MIERIVIMTFREDFLDEFKSIFKKNKSKIGDFEGCQGVDLWNDLNNPCIFSTYSRWNSETDLNNYRNSDLFKDVWKKTKSGFSEKPRAHSFIIASN